MTNNVQLRNEQMRLKQKELNVKPMTNNVQLRNEQMRLKQKQLNIELMTNNVQQQKRVNETETAKHRAYDKQGKETKLANETELETNEKQRIGT